MAVNGRVAEGAVAQVQLVEAAIKKAGRTPPALPPASADDPEPALVVVAAPPDVTSDVVLAELEAHPGAIVTDVASVKGYVLAELRASGADLSRYVGSHPMAGRERSGPVAAVPDLFDQDVRRNTRTVDAPWWQRLVFAPNGVNYHLEHHLLASVPCYRLSALRTLLRQRGALDGMPEFRGYGAVLRHAVQE